MRILLTAALIFGLASCAPSSKFDASPEEAAAKAFAPSGPSKLTIFTVVNNRTGSGGHTALMVSGSQQVIFDPAGSFKHASIPERGDVLYGMSPVWVQAYKSAHARSEFHVVSQEIQVTPAQAERALQVVQSYGAVPSAFCSNSTSNILRQVPGFEDIKVTFFPIKFMEQIETIPGVKTERYYEDDAGDVTDGIAAAL